MRKNIPRLVPDQNMKIEDLVNEINTLIGILERLIGADDYVTSEPNGTVSGKLGESVISLISGVYKIHKCYGGTTWKSVAIT